MYKDVYVSIAVDIFLLMNFQRLMSTEKFAKINPLKNSLIDPSTLYARHFMKPHVC